ncbi:MAG: glycosyltransferase [Pirellulales bacterium]|nr:glycosyltransferase [Pirellulales bacterium]
MSYVEMVATALAAWAVVQTLLVLWQIHENLRFVRSRLRLPPAHDAGRRVALIAPCKGLEFELERNLAPLFTQDYSNYELLLVVESEADSAVAAIRRLIARHPRRAARLVVAGLATDSGQKVHNLRVATEHLPAEVEVLAFVDSDARPASGWLRQLVERLDRPEVGASSGYRWFIPAQDSWAEHALTAANGAVAAMLGGKRINMVWGGSWAIRRETFEEIKLRDAWQGTLSDDLVASEILYRAGKQVNFEPRCMVASPLETTPASASEFARRQYTIGRFYAPSRWAISTVGISLAKLVGASGIVAMVLYLVGHRSLWCSGQIAALVALCVLGFVRAAYRQRLAVLCLSAQTDRLASSRRSDFLAWPLFSLANWGCLLGSLWNDTVTWRGNRYQIRRGGQIRLVERETADATHVERQAPRPPHFPRGAGERKNQRSRSARRR